MGDTNSWTSSNQAILLRNYSNPNPLSWNEDLELDKRYKISYEDIGENLFETKLIKFCSA